MKFIQKLANERFARSASKLMKYACYFVIGFTALCTLLSFLGRQSFTLHARTGTYENAIYAEKNHEPHSRSMTVFMGDDIHVWTNDSDQLDLTMHIGLSLLYAVQTVPMMLAFWFLSRVFSNIHRGQIFSEQTSVCLLCYGLIQCASAVLVPFIKLLLCWLTNLLSSCQISIATGQSSLNALFPSIAFLVAAYIIHYGVHLQDEVDHTL